MGIGAVQKVSFCLLFVNYYICFILLIIILFYLWFSLSQNTVIMNHRRYMRIWLMLKKSLLWVKLFIILLKS